LRESEGIAAVATPSESTATAESWCVRNRRERGPAQTGQAPLPVDHDMVFVAPRGNHRLAAKVPRPSAFSSSVWPGSQPLKSPAAPPGAPRGDQHEAHKYDLGLMCGRCGRPPRDQRTRTRSRAPTARPTTARPRPVAQPPKATSAVSKRRGRRQPGPDVTGAGSAIAASHAAPAKAAALNLAQRAPGGQLVVGLSGLLSRARSSGTSSSAARMRARARITRIFNAGMDRRKMGRISRRPTLPRPLAPEPRVLGRQGQRRPAAGVGPRPAGVCLGTARIVREHGLASLRVRRKAAPRSVSSISTRPSHE